MPRRLVTAACFTGVLALLAGCSTGVYRAYDGRRRPPEAVATVDVSPTIDVRKIEGRKGPGLRAYMPGRSDRIELLPGTNTIVVRYSTIYGTERDDHEAFYSEDVPVTFDARPGGRYRFAHEPVPEDPIAARTPRAVAIWIEDASGAKVKALPRPPPPAAETAAASAPPHVEKTRIEPVPEPPAKEDLETLNLLKFWWGRADDEERRAFLRWIEP